MTIWLIQENKLTALDLALVKVAASVNVVDSKEVGCLKGMWVVLMAHRSAHGRLVSASTDKTLVVQQDECEIITH